jgi:hypothetical protein
MESVKPTYQMRVPKQVQALKEQSLVNVLIYSYLLVSILYKKVH